jgi:hypothetical protein
MGWKTCINLDQAAEEQKKNPEILKFLRLPSSLKLLSAMIHFIVISGEAAQ